MPTERQLDIILESELEFKTFKEEPMSNNKLPTDAQERIKADANTATSELNKNELCGPIELMGYRKGYIAGATAVHERAQLLVKTLKQVEYHLLLAKNKPNNTDYKGLVEHLSKAVTETLEQWKSGKEQTKAKEGIIRVILAGAYDVSKDAASAEEYLKSEGVDVAQIKANAQYFTWKAELIRITKEKTGESGVRINDEEAVKWYNDGFTPEQTFRETWQSDGD